MTGTTNHFKGKNAVDHVVEAQAKGIIASAEIHGTEIPGSIAAATDSVRETAVLILLIHLFDLKLDWPPNHTLALLIVAIFGWLVWKTGRSAWLGWSRLERLHRVLKEEKWEIEHNRTQEREELKALYMAKGFQGTLLEEVLDVLMADGDRLLKVMIEEELGLTLEVHEHPLKQALGSFIGVLVTAGVALAGFYLASSIGLYVVMTLLIGLSASISARIQGNEIIHAVVWNIAIVYLSIGMSYFLFDSLGLH